MTHLKQAMATGHHFIQSHLNQRQLTLFLSSITLALSAHSIQASQSANQSASQSEFMLAQADAALREHLSSQGFASSQDIEFEHTDNYQTKHNGIQHIYYRQMLNGLPIVNAQGNLNIDENGEVFGIHARFFSEPTTKQQSLTRQVSANEALNILATELNIPLVQSPLPIATANTNTELHYTGGSLSQDPIPVKSGYYAAHEQTASLRPVWDIVVRPYNTQDWWHAWVDAADGRIIRLFNWTADASYRVFALPKESPPDGPRTLEVDIADPIASPFGWHDTDGISGAEFTDTRGNNVSAQEDTNADNTGGRRPDGGPSLSFDFPLDLNTQQPSEYEDFAITNLFYWNNIAHDVLYRHGFDEISGNFQQNNYGNGGFGNDAVRAEAQDGSGTNNANFGTPPDGQSGRMQMFVFTPPAVLSVNAPPAIAGNYRVNPAAFGAPLNSTGVSANISLVDDGSGTPSEGCGGPLINFPAGDIALIDRGGCEFGTKALNAENAGARAVVVVNNVAGNSTISMAPGAVGDQVTISAVMVGNTNGNIIRAELATGVNGTVRLDSDNNINRDSDLDAGVIVHEYGHGVSNRLTGGPSNASCLFGAQQAGEGWSDFLALVFTAQAGDSADAPRGVGRYVIFRDNDPAATIRPAPYSRNMSINSLTYGDIITAGQAGSNISIPHGVGTVFATALWDMYWNLVDRHGFDPDLYNGTGGNQLALRLVLDGMKMQPCGPTFLDARDAILMADTVNNGSANQCEIWDAFARRGMGFSAQDGGSSDSLAVTPTFDLPSSCGVLILDDGFESP